MKPDGNGGFTHTGAGWDDNGGGPPWPQRPQPSGKYGDYTNGNDGGGYNPDSIFDDYHKSLPQRPAPGQITATPGQDVPNPFPQYPNDWPRRPRGDYPTNPVDDSRPMPRPNPDMPIFMPEPNAPTATPNPVASTGFGGGTSGFDTQAPFTINNNNTQLWGSSMGSGTDGGVSGWGGSTTTPANAGPNTGTGLWDGAPTGGGGDGGGGGGAGNFFQRLRGYSGGGLASLVGSPSDGMADNIPAMIGGQQPVALSGGEVVIPADVVSHFGNGNTNAGAQQFYDMMDRIRQARTGTKQQGKQINPRKYMPV